ncbi:MAG: sulfite exporter TauE/SafE family protein [Bacteroidales bacterium]|nr:sulfite exporter TauE/SafE family protein [Bacteroidales bacterium]
MEANILFLVALFVVAVLYASVGHGGASGYLALMALFGISTMYMRASALTLNLFVSAVSFYAFCRAGHFKIKILIPFVLGSIPMAFLGARISIDPQLFKYILGAFLAVAVLRMVYVPGKAYREVIPFNFVIALLVGAFLGFFSGLIGIGGGIILSPVLLLLGWANVKETAAISAIFIFLNSASGILGLYSSGIHISPDILYWVVVAFAGGLLGAYVGSYKLSLLKLRYLLAFVLLLASVKLFFA